MFLTFPRHCFVVVLLFLFLTGTTVSRAQQADNDAANLIAEAGRLFAAEKYGRAVDTALKAAKLDPKDFRPWAIIGYSRVGEFKMKEASEAFAKATELKPDHATLWFAKAYADAARNAATEAVASVRKAIELDPKQAAAHNLLGDLLVATTPGKDKSEAIAAFRAALKLRPDLVGASARLAAQLSLAGDVEGAAAVYRDAMEADPVKTAFRMDLGRLLVKKGSIAEARKLWDERKSDVDNTFPNFITLLDRAEKTQLATARLAAAPEDPSALVEMGLIVMDGESWVVDGRQERSLTYFKKALAIKPDFAPAQFAIGKAYVQIADTYKTANADVDREIAKLRKMDAKLAAELETYRREYSGGLRVVTGPPPPVKPKL
jgi:tetratricopeptide (TPR) repeat protein